MSQIDPGTERHAELLAQMDLGLETLSSSEMNQITGRKSSLELIIDAANMNAERFL